jgi:tungstate transport system substrate-binding protein
MIRIILLLSSLAVPGAAHADEFMTLAATRSPALAGLLAAILPAFQAASNVPVHVVAVEPGAEAAAAQRGEADALLFDDRAAQDKLVADGDGLDRRDVLFDEFVIVGPAADPAHIRGLDDARKALAQIAAQRAPFVGGDDGDARRVALRLWQAAGIVPGKDTPWYRDLADGKVPALDATADRKAYSLVARAAWETFRSGTHSAGKPDLEILTQNDPALNDTYASVLVSPAKWPRVKFAYARIWHEWLMKPGREAVASYTVSGRQVFFPAPH